MALAMLCVLLPLVVIILLVRPSSEDSGRIINGIKSKQGKWPFMVSFLFQGEMHFCGGSILNEDTILTATHCAYVQKTQNAPISPGDLAIYVGHARRTPVDKAYLYQAKEIIVNEVFQANGKYNNRWFFDFSKGHDVALVKLARKITFEKGKVEKVCLPAFDAVPIAEKCIVMGWGAEADGSQNPSVDLMETTVPLMKCPQGHDPKTIFCAGDPKAKHDSCQGDSGGPLVCPHKANPNEYLQFGVVSYGDGCGNGGYYANVTTLLSWIATHMVASEP